MKNFYALLITLLFSFTINSQIIDIPDADFKNILVNTNCVDTDDDSSWDDDVDTNNDGEIQVSEAEAVFSLNLTSDFSSSVGLEYFVNLIKFQCSTNAEIATIDLSNSLNLEEIWASYNPILNSINITGLTNLIVLNTQGNGLTSLDVSTNINLITLRCDSNNLINLNTSNNINLTTLTCGFNFITNLDLSANTNLDLLNCRYNELTNLNLNNQTVLRLLTCSDNSLSNLILSTNNLTYLDYSNTSISNLDISQNTSINYLDCSSNQILELDVSNHSALSHLYCNNNLLTTLDISNNPLIEDLDCSYNDLISLNVKNGFINWNNSEFTDEPSYFDLFDFSNNPNLEYVCGDDLIFYWTNEINVIQGLINQYGYSNCHVNSYCSFDPGAGFYTIEGNVAIDNDTNGCDSNDEVFPNLNFAITDGTETGNFISNSSGNYSIPVGDGTHTITPVLENQNYFTITPSSLVVDFPTDTSPFMQDFCITPNGTHDDLEITLIPLELARPGFDTDYKLIYKNKGTTIVSGSIDLIFQDELMDFVSASPSENVQATNMLSWNFTDVTPFETREIDFTMNLNTPTETPALNGDDILAFTATLNTSETDETPEDNIFTLNQTVVNSYDPNDKTCLEGDFITPETIGKYVHYMIRFENTGTANAINVVVKDHIDTTKYDLSTLVPLHASHDYVARIKDNSQDHYIEFIFENINLPFDDANNDGYVAFKIKTLNTLVLGDTFENEAEIYFDFNFPIITDSAQTTVATLSTDEFELANNTILLYPNPTTNLLHLDSKHAIKHIIIYDIFGRVIKEIAMIGSKTELNISTENLTAGTYFIKIKTAQGDTIKKLIKN